MTSLNQVSKWIVASGTLFALLILTGNANALDKAYSRKGGFTGFGLGGGAAFIQDGDPAGDIDMNLQLGLGASEKLTVALNIDGRIMLNNDMTMGMIVPGPDISIFIFKGLYVHAGVGLAMVMPKDADFAVGMDAGVGVGIEKFVNTNLAGYISADVDYFLVGNDYPDIITLGIWLGIRYY